MSSSRYVRIRPLSAGETGRVWLAEDQEQQGRRVAVKELHPGTDVSMLAREFDLLRHLFHPHVAAVLDFHRGDTEQDAYLVEAFIDGVELDTACDGLDLQSCGRLLVQVLRGMEYVHARGLVHGDIKPANILVAGCGAERSACLIDFGLAAWRGETAGGVSGTPSYLAPEVIQEQPASPSSDLYSFGVVAYEALAGRRPFAHAAGPELFRAHLEEIPESPSRWAPQLPATADAVLLRLLEKRPEDRYGTAREALLALSQALGLGLAEETVETLQATLRGGPLVGRQEALRSTHSMWQGLRQPSDEPRMHMIWWTGASGTGRSRLLRHVLGDALIDGARGAYARGGEGGALGAVCSWLRTLSVSRSPLLGARDRWESIEWAATDLIAVAVETPVLLVLDDADRADDMTLDLIRVILDRLVASYAPDTEGEAPRIALVVAGTEGPKRFGAAHAGLLEQQSLSSLDEGTLRRWLDQLFPSASGLPEDFLAGVYRLTQGLPGHVVTLLSSLVANDRLGLREGVLTVDPQIFESPLPASLQEALNIRESTLTSVQRLVLDTLRVLGDAAPLKLVIALHPSESEAVLQEALTSLVDRGLIGVVPDSGSVRYRAEGGGAMLDDDRRRERHAVIARTLLALGGRETVRGFGSAHGARHAVDAVRLGETRLAAAAHRAALAGAQDARIVHAAETEMRLLQWALEMAKTANDGRPIALRLAKLQRRLGRSAEARVTYESVRSDSGASSDQVAEALLGLSAVAYDHGDYELSDACARELLDSSSFLAESAERAARAQLRLGRYENALADCEKGLTTCEQPDTKAGLSSVRALVYYYTERLDEALSAFESAAQAYQDAADPVGHAAAINGCGLIHQRRGDFSSALAAYEESLQIAETSGDRKRRVLSAMNIGTVLHETGRAVEALARYRESLSVAELLGDGDAVAKAALNLANLLIYLHRLPEARYWLDRSRGEAERRNDPLLVAYNQALIGKLYHREGALDSARAALLESTQTLRDIGNVAESVEMLVELGCVARTAGDIHGIEHFVSSAVVALAGASESKQQGWITFLQGTAKRLSGALEAAIEDLRAAMTLSENHQLYELTWLCEVELGRCYRELGNEMEARARFKACSERLLGLAAVLSGRERDLFLSERERKAALDESRMALMEQSTPPAQIREGREQLLRMMEINRRLVSERDLQALLEYILDSAISLTGAERGFVLLGTEGASSDDFAVRAARNIDQESLRRNRKKVSHSITRDVIESGEPIMTVDAGDDVRFRETSSVHHLKLRSILCFPLSLHGVVIGAIYLDNRFQSSTFSERDLSLVAAFGDQAAVAISNARYHERSERDRTELTASNERIEALNEELKARVDDQAVRLEEIQNKLAQQHSQLETRYRYDNIIGTSPAMQRVFGVLDRVTDTSVPVLVQGESGTGKELVARAIHYNGRNRRNRPFVSVNCAALTETLLESELFGHVRGAFTGADRDRKGLFEVANGGTLFLDEVADMSLGMQAKLLRALQEGEIWPVGARRSITVDVRIVAACNRDLAEMVQTKEFRQDLYFRLHVVRLILPPLRERGEDLILLVQHFLAAFAEKNEGRVMKLTQAALDRLLYYSWPGNIRELEACLMNACLFCDGELLTEAHLSHKPELFDKAQRNERTTTSEVMTASSGERLDLGNMTLAQLEERAILAALECSEGNKVEAARRLGITRQTLYNKLKSLGIEVRRRVRQT